MPPEFFVILLLFLGMFFLLGNRNRRQQREAVNLQASLVVGSRIMTTAGLFATVVALDETSVTLETAPGQRSRWDRRAVARLVTDDADAEEVAEGATQAEDAEPVKGEAAAGGDVGETLGRETTQGGAASADAPSHDTAPPDRP